MELISKEVVKQIINSGRTKEQMLGMVECAVTFGIESSTDGWNDLLLEVSGMSQEELIDAFVKGYGELAQSCGYTTEQIEKTEKVIRRKTKNREG